MSKIREMAVRCTAAGLLLPLDSMIEHLESCAEFVPELAPIIATLKTVQTDGAELAGGTWRDEFQATLATEGGAAC